MTVSSLFTYLLDFGLCPLLLDQSTRAIWVQPRIRKVLVEGPEPWISFKYCRINWRKHC
jgi:hypothetical protein